MISAHPQWRITIDVPMSVDQEKRQRLFDAIAEAAHEWDSNENWAESGHFGWDVDVSGAPADETADVTILRKAVLYGGLEEQYQAMQHTLYPDLYAAPTLFDPTPPSKRAVVHGIWIQFHGWVYNTLNFRRVFYRKQS